MYINFYSIFAADFIHLPKILIDLDIYWLTRAYKSCYTVE